MAQLCRVWTEDVETLSAKVKLAQEIDESARESEPCDFHVKRVLTGYGGDVEKDAVALDEEKGEIIIVELRRVHQFNNSIDSQKLRSKNQEQRTQNLKPKKKLKSKQHQVRSIK